MMYIIGFIIILLVVYVFLSAKQEISTLKGRIDVLESKMSMLEKAKDCEGNNYTSRKVKSKDESKPFKEDYSLNKSQNKEVHPLEKKVNKENVNISDETLKKEVGIDANSSQLKVGCVSDEKLVDANATFLYAKQFDKGELKICDKSDAFYKLQIVSDDEAKFEFCGDLSRAMNNFNAVFDDVIDYSGSSSTATKCNMVEKGEAKRISDSKWKVTKKAKIKFL
ncbi:MAG: hypothetical protein J6Q03_02225 [Paludibacteraceae bacterium]|nr:hypothetical protein [Paludibacteraceae bacterium]